MSIFIFRTLGRCMCRPYTCPSPAFHATPFLRTHTLSQCHSCRKPYFGGLVSCEPAAPPAGGGGGEASVGPGAGAAADAQAAERALADIKPSELLCGKCSAGSGGASCSEHGQVLVWSCLLSLSAEDCRIDEICMGHFWRSATSLVFCVCLHQHSSTCQIHYK